MLIYEKYYEQCYYYKHYKIYQWVTLLFGLVFR